MANSPENDELANVAAITNGDVHAPSNATPNASAPGHEGGVIYIDNGHPRRQATRRRQPAPALVAANPATMANSLGVAWSLATTSIDNARSRKWGVVLTAAKHAQGIDDFQKGDFVEIEVGIGDNRYRLIGRASRKSTAYFWIDELASAGIGVHESINVVIIAVHSGGAVQALSTSNDGGVL